ncbi:MAG: integral membrane sensor signal transduction histidine kinase [Candidatus Ozemobacter sibiricus]|jgi:signal transduction histidine kinase|uniref:histidine kinase n=1 Tax=Candidatus Ozemobacter sibiricus TaxID=2268124 RepID=A0A367ZU95_9BACT|nr:MAG: integral membrane sensor signal transduction histidine kinase [Candidatus Ozemobacter sibiricus]
MRWFGLSQRIFVGFLALAVSVLVVMGLSLRQFREALDSTEQLADADDFLHAGNELQDDLLKLIQAQEVFDQYLDEQTWRNYFEFSRRLEVLLDKARKTPTFRRSGRELEDLDRSRLEMAGLLANATFTIHPDFTIGAVSPATLQKIKAARSQIHQQIRAVLMRERDSRQEDEALLRAQLSELWQRLWLVFALMLFGGGLFAWYLHRAAMAPLRHLIEVIRHPEETGIPGVATASGAREMRDLIESFNQLTLALRHHQKRLSSMLTWAVSVAHEVRNPLAAIGTAIQVLEGGFPADHPDKPIFREILKEVERVNRIISDLLIFSRPRPLAIEPLRWDDLFEELRILLASALTERQITLEVTIDPAVGTTQGDRDQLHRALLNLLNNALEAIGQGGRIVVRVTAPDPSAVVITVADSGPGIPEADRERVFDPFFSRKTKGTGLGLAIVADIIERHGGSVRVVRDATLPGACFEIHLPRERASATEPPAKEFQP